MLPAEHVLFRRPEALVRGRAVVARTPYRYGQSSGGVSLAIEDFQAAEVGGRWTLDRVIDGRAGAFSEQFADNSVRRGMTFDVVDALRGNAAIGIIFHAHIPFRFEVP